MLSAVLDTNVLWPSLQRDFLLSLAVEGCFSPKWSSVILDELAFHEARKLTRRGISEVEAKRTVEHLRRQMTVAFGDAIVGRWQHLDGTFGLPDPDDEHVVAAAVIAGAEVIVTENRKDFPSSRLPGSLRAVSAREFAYDTVRQHYS